MIHSEKCLAKQAEIKRLHDEWVAKWPGYCRTCGGSGEITTPGCCVPYGSTSVRLPDDVDLCRDCAEQGICSRCGGALIDPEGNGSPCVVCGWNYDDHCPPAGLDDMCECEYALQLEYERECLSAGLVPKFYHV